MKVVLTLFSLVAVLVVTTAGLDYVSDGVFYKIDRNAHNQLKAEGAKAQALEAQLLP